GCRPDRCVSVVGCRYSLDVCSVATSGYIGERSHRSSTFHTCGQSSIATADWRICVQGAPTGGSPLSHRIGCDAEGNSMGCRDDRCGTVGCGGGINDCGPRNGVGGAGGSICREHLPDVLQRSLS